jgi:4-aminobutyrate aminotransferase-like enzyme
MAGPVTYYSGGDVDAATGALIRRRQAALGGAYRLFYEHPLQLVRGLGSRVWDADGREYLDAYNNVPAVGHAHPRVVAALSEQAALLNTHTRYLSEPIIDYAEQLLATVGFDAHVIFTCTGSEANDLALRIVRQATGRTDVIVTSHAYHGVTESIAAISPSLGGAESLPATTHLVSPADLGGSVRSLLDSGVRPAALIVDTILASDGIVVDPPGFAEAAAAVQASGGLFIADEVQAGFGRLGTGMWGYNRHGLAPDMVTLGKPMGNGHPVAGLIGRADLIDAFGASVRYFNTFGGNPVSIAAAQATLDVIRDEGLIEHASDLGGYLVSLLTGLDVVDVRGVGLYVGVELDSTERTVAVVNRMREAGVLLAASGPDNTVLKIRPPLVFSRADAELLATELERTLNHGC